MIQNPISKIRPEKALSTEFKQFFLLEFTKQLILHSVPMEILKLKEVISEEGVKDFDEKKEFEEHIREVLNPEDEYKKSGLSNESFLKESFTKLKQKGKPKIRRKSFPFETFKNVRLTIPETNLPERLNYLKPIPTKEDIDLGKLNPLLKDAFVKTIECPGPNSNILVSGRMGNKKTNIVLSEEEIKEIINKFSEASRIPVQEGIFKVVVGRFIFMTIVSEVVGSKFIIKKMISSRIPVPGNVF